MSTFADRVALLRQAYDAFNRRDVDAVLSMLDLDVDWPNLLDQTTAHGHDAVRAYWARQFQAIDPHVEPTEFAQRGEQVVVLVHQVVRDRHGNPLRDSHVAHVYTFRGERILSMQVYPTLDDVPGGASDSTGT